jgi:hypothetical protein
MSAIHFHSIKIARDPTPGVLGRRIVTSWLSVTADSIKNFQP